MDYPSAPAPGAAISKLDCSDYGPVTPIIRRREPHVGAWCPTCERHLRWLPQGTAEERERRRQKALLAAMAGRDTTGRQADFLQRLGVAEREIPWDMADAARMIDRLLRTRRDGRS
ncbi:MAG: hypothetical protein FJZ01_01575 [Candidatus Sericytochromatia bacterium]|nr:hypothetical protein [Candidatus Tanganyikabacteria bacterium]